MNRRRHSRKALTALFAAAVLVPTGLANAAPSTTPTTRAVVDFQAESATISQGVVESNHAGYTGTGFVNLDNVVGSHVQFSVPAAAAGPATLTFRFANGTTTNRPMDITVNGTLVSDELAFAGTGAWTSWQDRTITATLVAGTNTVRATSTTVNGGPNLDRLRVDAPTDTQRPTAPGQPACGDIAHNALTLACQQRVVPVDYGVLRVKASESTTTAPIVDYEEKPEIHYTVSMGVYVISPGALRHIPSEGSLDIPDLVLRLIDAGERVGSYRYDGLWLDIGRRDDYERALSEYGPSRQGPVTDGSKLGAVASSAHVAAQP
jgi:hypothetical protein